MEGSDGAINRKKNTPLEILKGLLSRVSLQFGKSSTCLCVSMCGCVWCMVYSCICALWAGQSSCVWSYQEHCMAIIHCLPLFIDETTISGSQLHHLPLHHQDSSDLLLTADLWAECETCWFPIKFTTTMSSKGTNSYTLDTYSHYLTWLVKLSTGWFNQFNLKLFTETRPYFSCVTSVQLQWKYAWFTGPSVLILVPSAGPIFSFSCHISFGISCP